MQKTTLILAVAVSVLTSSAFAHDRNPHEHCVRESHNGHLTFTITYLDPWGETIADATGLHFYHLVISSQAHISPPLVTNDPNTILPPQYWTTYPLYYAGMTMNYRLTLKNDGKARYRDIKIDVYQAYLNPDGSLGPDKIGSDALRQFLVPEVGPEQSLDFMGSIAIPTNATSGLDQTDVIVYQDRKPHPGMDDHDEGDDLKEFAPRDMRRHVHGKIIFWEPQVGIWCPPGLKPKI